MSRRICLFGILVIGVLVWPGCQRRPAPAEGGDIDFLTLDANENGFPDVPVPEGVDVEATGTMNVRLANTITKDDVIVLVQELVPLDAGLLGLVEINLDMTITLNYEGGITDVLEDSEALAPFDKRFEVACPSAANIAVEVVAEIPFTGPLPLDEFNADLTQGAGFECGQTFEVNATVDENGLPQLTLNVS